MVTVAEEPGQISVRQSRFLSTGDVMPDDDDTTWWIPLGLTSGAQIKSPGSALTVKEDTIRDVDESFYKLNEDQSGFYRTNYPPDRLMQLGRMRERLSTQDKIGLMGDATALAVAGDGTTSGLLTLLEYFNDESSYL
jgi:aminopeptidase N